MADAKKKMEDEIDKVAHKSKNVGGKAIDKTKQAAKNLGQKVEKTGEKIKHAGK